MVVPFLSSGSWDVVGMWLVVVGTILTLILGKSSFHNAILFGRILDLTVTFKPSPRYSPRSDVYWGQVVLGGAGLLGFLKRNVLDQ